MTTPLELVSRLYQEVISGGDDSVIPEIIAEDFTFYGPSNLPLPLVPEKIVGRDAWYASRVKLEEIIHLDVHIEESAQQGDALAVRLKVDARLNSPFLGLEPTGEVVTYTAINFFRARGNLLREERMNEDFTGVFMQLGLKLYDPHGNPVNFV